MAIGLKVTDQPEEEVETVEPLNPPFPYFMVPFPYDVAGVKAEPPKKEDLNESASS